jgi:hypothetical protein
MAIKKGEDLKTQTLADYYKTIGATDYAVKDKSIHFRKGEIYLGFIIRSTDNKELAIVDKDDNLVDSAWELPLVLDGKHGADWLGVPSKMNWKTK